MEGVAVVTGGASGIGAACCRALAAEGMEVAVLDLGDRAGAVAAEVGGRPYSADVSDEAALSACAARIEAEMGPVSVLVNNLVGSRIRPRAATAGPALNEAVDKLWMRWADQGGADGHTDFHGLTSLAVREMIEAARYQRSAAAGAWPIACPCRFRSS